MFPWGSKQQELGLGLRVPRGRGALPPSARLLSRLMGPKALLGLPSEPEKCPVSPNHGLQFKIAPSVLDQRQTWQVLGWSAGLGLQPLFTFAVDEPDRISNSKNQFRT